MERLKLMSLLDASFKKNHCAGLDSNKVTSELSHHLRDLQDEVYFSVVLPKRRIGVYICIWVPDEVHV
jgi:hypothetical protein